MTKPIIYFLCIGNSCRSQMAEGFAKHYLGDSYEIMSAGIESICIHPIAIEVMKEKGIDISNQSSDLVSVNTAGKASYVITLCKDAKERCPAILSRSHHYHWGFDDPAAITGANDEILEEFRRIRDEIEETIVRFAKGEKGEVMNLNNFDFSVYKKKRNFGEIIRILRVENGFSASQLAEQLRVTEDFIMNTELNRTHPSKFFIHALANVLQKNYDDLLDELYDVEHKEILKLLK
ncbi:helix-turn-helix domain-containing protein [Rossellomorea aquimaris]|uniref:HTH cro/C1-type domain-containing protein n=2 Tax=Rossellomorea TaxID=2837508 RepID=A0A5D4TY37_9BACI|nr:helix-turn-helix domain-containing protein [Rossellomorea aquimaris]TYS79906.1 hypothetical protein FZC80_09755 [Rossellomorea aquimaris]